MNPIETVADRTYVINLAKRTDRMESARRELGAIGLTAWERFDAYGPERPSPYLPAGQPMTGWWGNKLSHYGVIDEARRNGLRSVMVFEDDVILHPEFNAIAEAAIAQLAGRHWDWLQFGGNHRYFGGVDLQASPIDGKTYVYPPDGLEPVAPNLARVRKMLTAHAYIARESVFPFILANAIDSPLSIDGFYAYEVHNRFACYCVVPCAAKQAPGISDIGNVHANYTDYIGD